MAAADAEQRRTEAEVLVQLLALAQVTLEGVVARQAGDQADRPRRHLREQLCAGRVHHQRLGEDLAEHVGRVVGRLHQCERDRSAALARHHVHHLQLLERRERLAAEVLELADGDFRARDIHRDGAIVVVRPDHYVAGIFPLQARDEIKAFFAQHMLPAN